MSACNEMDYLMANLRVRLPGSTDAAIELELFNTINEFFRRTMAWRHESVMPLSRNVVEYPLFAPSGTALVRVIDVRHKSRPLAAIGAGGSAASQRGRLTPDEYAGDMDPIFYPDETIPAVGPPLRYAIFYPQYITIDIAPSEDATSEPLVVVLALTLGQEARQCDCGEWGIPTWMFDMFFDDWLDGVQARMMSQLAKPWSNPTMATYHGKRFRNAMAFRRQEARRGYAFDVPAWRYPVGGFITR